MTGLLILLWQFISLPVQLKLVFEVVLLIALTYAVCQFVTIWRGMYCAPVSSTCVHAVVMIVERPMLQGMVRDILVVPLGSLLQMVLRRGLRTQPQYPAWRMSWTSSR